MKRIEVKGKGAAELRTLESELRKQLFALRMKHHSGQLDDTSQLQKLRRDVARVRCQLSAVGEQA